MKRHIKWANYLKNLTVRRMFNYLLVKGSLFLKSPYVYGMPLSLFIEPTNICNLKCPLCPTGNGSLKRKKGCMDMGNFRKIIDGFGRHAFSVTLWNYGEPFINKEIIGMIRYAKARGLKVITSANGFGFENDEVLEGIVDSGLDELIVALDGCDEKTHCAYRVNSKFDVLVNGLRRIVELKRIKNRAGPYIEAQFIVMRHNEHQVEQIKNFAEGLGADELVLKTVNLYDKQELAKRFVPRNLRYSRYKIADGKYVPVLYRKENRCDGLWIGMNIDWDGTVVPCCYDPYEKARLGNIFAEGRRIWNSGKFAAFRKQILKDKGSIPLCANCPSNVVGMDFARIRFGRRRA
ncbi:SPASM domain-containing protein [archaeon]|nr:SPASM domain-containing protein [archaeon]